MSYFKKLIVLLICFVAFSEMIAQEGFDMFSSFGFKSKKERDKNIVTRITSDTLDVQYKDNIVVFKGNVVLDDQDVTITCDKMIIRLADDPEKKVGKKPKLIECLGSFVATRKIIDPAEKKGGSQKAVAGKAVLEVDSGKITMYNKPMIIRGTEALKGSKITIWLQNEKLVAENAEVEAIGGDLMGGDNL